MSEQLRERLAAVARLRREAAIGQEQLAEAKAALDETPEAKRVFFMRGTQQEVAAALAQAEQQARQEALAEYQATGNNKPATGVLVRITRRVQYDLARATAWCQTHAPMLMALDAKRFERAVREGIVVGAGVAEVVDEPVATLASDLSEYEEADE